MSFLHHIELLFERLKGMLADMGEDVEKWKLPMREDNGVITGLYAKVRNANVYAVINENASSLCCSINEIGNYVNMDELIDFLCPHILRLKYSRDMN